MEVCRPDLLGVLLLFGTASCNSEAVADATSCTLPRQETIASAVAFAEVVSASRDQGESWRGVKDGCRILMIEKCLLFIIDVSHDRGDDFV
ncbi:hypothetical protein F4805DRAFT_60028 [Annulohypoxylon moriforme]|nr:hypothetical protein F4805DRAFT_60028 [Annulohypoxylon moriforme]